MLFVAINLIFYVIEKFYVDYKTRTSKPERRKVKQISCIKLDMYSVPVVFCSLVCGFFLLLYELFNKFNVYARCDC